MKKLFFGLLFFILFSIIYLLAAPGAEGAPSAENTLPDDGKTVADVKPVKELRKIYQSDAEFRKLVDLMFQNVHETPEGKPNPWLGKNFDHLCAFFNEWYYFLPTTLNGLRYIRGFQIIYYKNKYGLQFVKEEPGRSWLKRFSLARGQYMDSKESVKSIPTWKKAPGINMKEYIVPPGGFKSFNHFFIRDIKPGARPINSPEDDSVIVAPADCLIEILDHKLTAGSEIPLKGHLQLNVKNLLNQSKLADRFVGGTAVRCILEPTYYHHFHSPVTGIMVESDENVPGLYYDSREDFSVFEHFHRGYYIIKTKKYGHVAMIPVGLATVSSVTFEDKYKRVTPRAPVPVRKGEKLGHFAYGGSLVILLFEPQRFTFIKTLQGQRIGVFE
jgi:phosphatidylserine decarboxylase